MKKIFLLGLSALCLFFILSCDDKENITPLSQKEIKLYGKKYSLATGAIWEGNKNKITSIKEYVYKDIYINSKGKQITDKVVGYTTGKETFETGNFCLSLYEKGLNVNESLKKAIGKGVVLSLYLASPKTDKLAEGKYSYNNNKKEFTFLGLLSSAYSSSLKSDQNITPAQITEGIVEVKQGGGQQYHITFNCKTSFGGEVSGTYVGNLKQISIKQDAAISSLYDLSIDGLSGQTAMKQTYFGRVTMGKSLDESYSNAFLYTQAGNTTTAKKAQLSKDDIDIALHWDKTSKTLCFKSPIAMRSYLEHKKEYDLLCHTKYKYAPSSFTKENFKKLSPNDLKFTMKEEAIKLNINPFTQRFIFFETGKNVRGVISVKSLTPATWKIKSQVGNFYTLEYLKNPGLVIDLKYLANSEIHLLR